MGGATAIVFNRNRIARVDNLESTRLLCSNRV